MAILGVYAEDLDFPNATPVTITTTAGAFRSDYARCAVACIGSSGAESKTLTFASGPITSCWIGTQCWTGGNNGATGAPARIFGLMKSGTECGLFIGTNNAGQLALFKYDAAHTDGDHEGTLLAAESGLSMVLATPYRIDIQIVNFGVAATVNVYVFGVLKLSFTGDVTISGITNLDQAALTQTRSYLSGYFSETIGADEDTRTFSLVTLAPSGAGTTDAWTGAYTDVNEIAIDDGNAVTTNTVSQNEQFALTDLPAGAFGILGVKEAVRASITAAATATKVALGINSGGTVDAGTPQSVITAWGTFERIMQVNPVTGASFTTAEINALQSNLQSGS